MVTREELEVLESRIDHLEDQMTMILESLEDLISLNPG